MEAQPLVKRRCRWGVILDDEDDSLPGAWSFLFYRIDGRQWRQGTSHDDEGAVRPERGVSRVPDADTMHTSTTTGGFCIDFPVASGHDSARYRGALPARTRFVSRKKVR
jgi:hypothetical protein